MQKKKHIYIYVYIYENVKNNAWENKNLVSCCHLPLYSLTENANNVRNEYLCLDPSIENPQKTSWSDMIYPGNRTGTDPCFCLSRPHLEWDLHPKLTFLYFDNTDINSFSITVRFHIWILQTNNWPHDFWLKAFDNPPWFSSHGKSNGRVQDTSWSMQNRSLRRYFTLNWEKIFCRPAKLEMI